MPALSSKLRAARKAAGLTQGQVAARLGITRGAVTHWESDDPVTRTQPCLDSLSRLAAIYQVPTAWFLSDEQPEVPSAGIPPAHDLRLASAFWAAVDYELLVAGVHRASEEGVDFATARTLAVFASGAGTVRDSLGQLLLAERLLDRTVTKHLLVYSPTPLSAREHRLAEKAGARLVVVRTPREAAGYLVKLP